MTHLGRRQVELMERIRVHGSHVPVLSTQADVDIFRSLERRGLVRAWEQVYAVSLHTGSYDATALTPAGRRALREVKT